MQNGDQLLAQQQIKGGVPETSLLVTDPQRSVLQTLNENHPPQSIAYTPYGGVFLNALLSLLGFNGERRDPVTGCYLLGNGYRAFNPVLKRFVSPDRLSPFGAGGLNAYAYCSGNPINRLDPTGHISFAITAKIQQWGRRAVTKLATKTKSIAVYPELSPIKEKLFRSPAQAARFRSRAIHFEQSVHYEMQADFASALTRTRNESRLQPLRSLSFRAIHKASLPTDKLPSSLQSAAKHFAPDQEVFSRHKLLEYLNSDQPNYGVNTRRFDFDRLLAMADGSHIPPLSVSSNQNATKYIAGRFIDELNLNKTERITSQGAYIRSLIRG